jgi:hypothetical protein
MAEDDHRGADDDQQPTKDQKDFSDFILGTVRRQEMWAFSFHSELSAPGTGMKRYSKAERRKKKEKKPPAEGRGLWIER